MEEKLKKVLFAFVKRVSKGNTTSEAETNALPEVAKVLASLLGYEEE